MRGDHRSYVAREEAVLHEVGRPEGRLAARFAGSSIPRSSDWPGAEKRSATTLENSRGPGGSFANVQPDAFLRSGNSTRFRKASIRIRNCFSAFLAASARRNRWPRLRMARINSSVVLFRAGACAASAPSVSVVLMTVCLLGRCRLSSSEDRAVRCFAPPGRLSILKARSCHCRRAQAPISILRKPTRTDAARANGKNFMSYSA